VAGSTRDVPLLVICLARPELLDARPGWQTPSDNATMVRLEPLAENDAAALLERALRARLVDEQTGRALEAAEGNPLFLEQLLAIHAEHGEQLDVPPTVHAVLAARIDRLPPAERIGDERLEAHAIVQQLFLRIQVDTEKAIIEARELGERLQVTFEVNQDARGLCKVWRLRALGTGSRGSASLPTSLGKRQRNTPAR
jgi:hypothetical protein